MEPFSFQSQTSSDFPTDDETPEMPDVCLRCGTVLQADADVCYSCSLEVRAEYHGLPRCTVSSSELDELTRTRPDDQPEEGGVPLPESPRLLRWVYGGASAWDLETYHASDATDHDRRTAGRALESAFRRGRWLSRGLHTFTGHTGGGKTALGCNLALAALEHHHPVVYLSLELDRREVASRLVALRASIADSTQRIHWNHIALGRSLSDGESGEEERLKRARDASIEHLKPLLPYLYVWTPDPLNPYHSPTVGGKQGLRGLVQEVWLRHERTPLVIFDYLQAPGIYARSYTEERRMPLRERIAMVTMQLRHLSKRHERQGHRWPGCPVVVLSTTARSNTARRDAVKGMDGINPDLIRYAPLEDLKALPKEAGEVEATAVTSWALSLEKSKRREAEPARLALRLAKNRKGPDGQWVPLLFDGATGRIWDDTDRYRLADQEEKTKRSADSRQPEAMPLGLVQKLFASPGADAPNT